MKKQVFFMFFAAFSLLAVSCVKENVLEPVAPMESEVDPWTAVPLKEVAALPGSHTVLAGFDNQTKSVLKESSIEWLAGDAFTLFGYNNEGSYSKTTYSTSSGGALASFVGGGSVIPDNGIHCVYPSVSFNGLIYLGSLLHASVSIPPVQDATAGSVAQNANLSYAQAATQDEDLHFKNMLALIKFKLAGDVVSRVKSVSFKGYANVAGGFYLSLENPVPAFETGYSSSSTTRTVKLEGDFEAGKDYYIALAPGVHEGFTMLFENNDGSQYVKKVSTKTLTLSRSTITDFGTISLGADFPAPEAPLTPYMKATAGAPKAVTLVVIPDGFVEADLDDYELKAKSGIDALFNTEPYKTYKNYFNVWILKQASNESGANITDGHGNITDARDCYFGSKWGDGYSDMSLNATKAFGFVEDNCPDIIDGSHDIKEVAVLVLINDARYGGISWNTSTGQTYCMVPVGDDGETTWSYPGTEPSSVTATPWETHSVTVAERNELGISKGTWRNTLVHEFGGHSFGKLGDEYWYNKVKSAVSSIDGHGWSPEPFALNISATHESNGTPWKELSDNAAILTAKDAVKYGRIGVFQGGDVSMFNRWRSEKISCMIDNRFYFSTWQRRLIVNRLMRLAGCPIPSFAEFLAKDVPDDPLRDGGGSPVILPDGLVNNIPPKPMPPLPPPVLVESF